jgi:uncharacterized alpha-E superfamily protein
MITTEEFFNACMKHDWYYEFSDDGRVYNRGKEAERLLESYIATNDTFKNIYNDFIKWCNREGGKPILQNYLSVD